MSELDVRLEVRLGMDRHSVAYRLPREVYCREMRLPARKPMDEDIGAVLEYQRKYDSRQRRLEALGRELAVGIAAALENLEALYQDRKI